MERWFWKLLRWQWFEANPSSLINKTLLISFLSCVSINSINHPGPPLKYWFYGREEAYAILQIYHSQCSMLQRQLSCVNPRGVFSPSCSTPKINSEDMCRLFTIQTRSDSFTSGLCHVALTPVNGSVFVQAASWVSGGSLRGRRWDHALNMPSPCTVFIFNGPVGQGSGGM